MTRPRILLLIPHLGGGGAEHVTTLLAENLSGEKYDLHLGLVTKAPDNAGSIAPWVVVHSLGARRVRNGAFRLLRLIWQLRPDVILSGMAHLNFLVLLLRPFFPLRTRVLIRQNGTVSSALASGELPFWTHLLYRAFYRRADWIICQSEAMAHDLCDVIKVPTRKVAVLPNPVDADAIRSFIESPHLEASHGPHLLAIGRLAHHKGFDLLLRALTIVKLRFPTADLTIAGDGPELTRLQLLSRELLIDKAVRFTGRVHNPVRLLSGASVFVLSSRHEGLPNVLLEAAAAGLPIAALPSSQGVVELLRARPGVFLANEISAEALASSILECLQAIQPGQRFQHSWVDEFQLERAVHVYESLIDAALAEEFA